ncbi:DUF4292 domain-containing protein [Lacihabitans sp. CS3-21]|uniref:DUF4292 domain-containing protein n=1 Tax=Lacihabitans sp. CS3-21 TaxID=2487332 RepID=UPI000BCD29CB|nr:DUF4292 domain-containing protein [Lacihabitans sp. CS3-21]MCP9745330.1 DUF4292 domain-containing protein [Lacihabitans sp. CS3-21]OYU66233.1 MAG: hypothetical protein CFE22_10185 [Cytophagaceae bacterium BCCC1]
MKILQKLFFAGFIIVVVSSCRSHKMKKNSIVLGTVTATADSVIVKKDSVVLAEIPVEEKVFFETKEIDFEKLKIKSKISIKTAKIDQNIPATIHVKKDSVIWISIAIGLEAARVSINPDSIFLLDRLNRKYYKVSFKELSDNFDFDLDFNMIQSLLVGNLPIKIDSIDIYKKLTEFNSISQKRNEVEIENRFDLEKSKLFYINATDKKTNTKLNIDYKSFINEDNKLVPTIISLLISGKNEAKIEFEHSKFDFLDRNIRFPFNIPKGYSLEKIPNF